MQTYNVSFYKNISDTTNKSVVPIEQIFTAIKNGKYKTQIDKLRKTSTKKEQDLLKLNLPNFTASGTFAARFDKDLIVRNGLIGIDIDSKDNPTIDFNEIKMQLVKDEFVFSFFISPLGKGLKVIIKINATQSNTDLYKSLQEYFLIKYKVVIDKSCKNVSRAMFVSHDPDLFHNPKSKIYSIVSLAHTDKKEVSSLPKSSNIIHHPKNVNECWEFTSQKEGFEDGNRNNFLLMFAGNCNRAGINEFAAINFSLNNATGLSEGEINKTVKSAYSNILEHGKFSFKEVEAKNENSNNKDVERIKGLYRRLNDNEGKFKDIIINHGKILELIASFGFRRFDLESNEYIFVKIENNILEQVSQVIIQDAVIDFLKSLPDALPNEVSKAVLLEKIRKGRETFFSKGFYSMLKNEVKFIFCTDTKDISFVFYKNGFVKCSKNGVEFLPYLKLVGYVWKKQILNRDFSVIKESQHEAKIFERFIFAVCGKDIDRLSSLKSLVGYLLHNYFETKLKAVVLTDSTISDEANGRTGKTLLGKSIQLIKPSVEINGKEFEPTDRFKYQKVKIETQIIILNDLKRNFSVENLFNDITEMVKVELKSQNPFELKAKFLLSTNRTLKIENASAKDRFIEFEFSDYYTEKYSPEMDLGKWLFGVDFNKLDWLEFDNFMMLCICYYLQNGMIQAKTINLHRRKLIEQTNEDFVNWFDGMIEGKEIKHLVEWDKKLLHDKFLNSYTDYKEHKFLKLQKNFTNYLITYSRYSDILEPFNENTDTRKSMEQRFILFRFKE